MKTLICLIATAGLAGCAAAPSSSEHHEVYVKPAMIMLTADQAAARGIATEPRREMPTGLPADVQALDTRAVIAPAEVKVYTINRATDPADRELMHEQHLAYRRETTPAWRLNAPTDQKILVGPRVTDGRGDLQPVLSKELVTFMTEQRRATEANQKAITALFQAVNQLVGNSGAQPQPSQANDANDQREPTPTDKPVPSHD